MKIKIKIPAKNKKWQAQFIEKEKRSAKSRTSAANLYQYLEGKVNDFYEANLGSLTHLCVNYGVEHPSEPNDWKNEGVYDNSTALLFSLASFLEDYFTVKYLREKLKQYGK